MKQINLAAQNYKISISFRDDDIEDYDFEQIREEVDLELANFEFATNKKNPDSEITKFNKEINEFKGSKDFFDYLADAIFWYGATDGIFNPFANSINSDFKNIKGKEWNGDDLFKLNNIRHDFPRKLDELTEYIDIDYENYIVKFKRQVELDLSGINKGIFIDRLTKRLKKYSEEFHIQFGGDNFYANDDPEDDWNFTINNPVTMESGDINLKISNEALSISGNTGQNHVIDDVSSYQLLNPQTQKKTNGNLALVIIKGQDCKTTDVLAKAFLIADEDEREELSNKFRKIQRMEVDSSGRVTMY
jgi:thiamine biosynthesis lipoprotein ApbE